MIPSTLNLPVPPSPCRKHSLYAASLTKMPKYEDFLTIKSQAAIPHPTIHPPEFDEFTIKPFNTDSSTLMDITHDSLPRVERTLSLVSENSVNKKQEIAIPVAKRVYEAETKNDVDGIERVFKQCKMQKHYIRVDLKQPPVMGDVYEATDKDLNFLYQLNKEILDGPQPSEPALQISQAQFERLVEEWEQEVGEGEIISSEDALDIAVTSGATFNHQILLKIYEHWRDSRELYKRSLLRKYWKGAHRDIANPNVAFRRRKENRFARRRSYRMVSPSDDLKRMKALRRNLDRGILLLANVRYREMLKLDIEEMRRQEFDRQLEELLNPEESATVKMDTDSQIDAKEKYYMERKSMEEFSKRGDTMAKSIRRLKKVSSKKKKKLVPTIMSSSALSVNTVCPQDMLHKPMPLENLSNYMPRNVQGIFTLPIRKSSIELGDLRIKLKESLGSLYLRNPEDYRVKVELGEPGDVAKVKKYKKKQQKMVDDGSSPQSNGEPHEELMIKIELKENIEKTEGKKVLKSTTVKYCISFHDATHDKKMTREPSEAETKEPELSCQSQENLARHNEQLRLKSKEGNVLATF